MYPKHLWPPLELVEAALDSQETMADPAEPGQVVTNLDGVSARKPVDIPGLLLPVSDLLQRRSALAARAFSDVWRAGCLLQITSNGLIIGVLLNRQVQEAQWIGWSAACETSWAGDFDVLLEPEDDPFEPMFGVIQTWNPVTIELSDSIQAKIVGEISSLRLEAIRAVAHEFAAGVQSSIPVEPGHIALRMASDKFLVLTGTPLSNDDERHAYQSAYRAAVARLMAKQLTQRLSQTHKVAAPCALSTADLRVQIKAQSPIGDVEQLMRSSGCEIVSGPDEQGFYSLKSHDVTGSKAVLTQSILVLQVTSL